MSATDLIAAHARYVETEAWRAALATAAHLSGSGLRREAQAALRRADHIASRIAHRAAVRARAARAARPTRPLVTCRSVNRSRSRSARTRRSRSCNRRPSTSRSRSDGNEPPASRRRYPEVAL